MAIEAFTNFHQKTNPEDQGGFGAQEIFAFRVLNMSFSIDPPSLLNGNGATFGTTVTGARLGDFVIASAPYDIQSIIVTAYVASADSVEIRLQNETGATMDLPSGTWKVKVIHDGL